MKKAERLRFSLGFIGSNIKGEGELRNEVFGAVGSQGNGIRREINNGFKLPTWVYFA